MISKEDLINQILVQSDPDVNNLESEEEVVDEEILCDNHIG